MLLRSHPGLELTDIRNGSLHERQDQSQGKREETFGQKDETRTEKRQGGPIPRGKLAADSSIALVYDRHNIQGNVMLATKLDTVLKGAQAKL